jgi:spore coat polysaccharide biosynthesis protein SpsF
MILAILQARMTSTRFPEKVMKLIMGKPMIYWQIDRILKSKRIDHLIVATSFHSSDGQLERFCQEINVECFRGDLNDVLDRYYQAAKKHRPSHIVRFTGDCPLLDWQIIDQVIDYHIQGGYDYTANTHPPTFPDGLDVEIMKCSILEQAWEKASLLSEREHVTLYIYQHPELFKLGNVVNDEDLSYLRWTVDEPEDFQFISQIYEKLYPVNQNFTMQSVLSLLKEHPEWVEINNRFERNAGLKKSLQADGGLNKRGKDD